MNTKGKITTAAALAALTVPAAAFGHDGDGDGDGKSRGAERSKSAQEQRSSRGDDRRVRGEDHRGKHKGWSHGRRAFVIAGVDGSGVPTADGPLAGPITLDPVRANRGAKKFLELTKTELRGEDTVTFGTAGDEVDVRYVGLEPGPVQPTDIVLVKGKLRRQEGSETKTLDIKKIVVLRKSAENDDD
jgi:hypothetical protein